MTDLQLGKKTNYQLNYPDKKILEIVPNPHPDTIYLVRLTCPEFTSICPVTSQPDFANLVIDYLPNKSLIESKSFKLYLFSYRNHGAFHEDCTVRIAKDLISIAKPKWLRIGGYWYPRGGIPIDIFFEQGKKPKDLWVPDQGIKSYSARQS